MTYSLAVTGVRAEAFAPIADLTLSDVNARSGNQQAAMRTGAQILCKGPDGAERYYTIDAERSRAGGTIVLLAV